MLNELSKEVHEIAVKKAGGMIRSPRLGRLSLFATRSCPKR